MFSLEAWQVTEWEGCVLLSALGYVAWPAAPISEHAGSCKISFLTPLLKDISALLLSLLLLFLICGSFSLGGFYSWKLYKKQAIAKDIDI